MINYSIGMRFTHSEEDYGEYFLAQIHPSKVILIGLSTGNRWSKAVDVKSVHKITQEEFYRITDGDSFILLS